MRRLLILLGLLLALWAQHAAPLQAQEATSEMPAWWIPELDGPWPPPMPEWWVPGFDGPWPPPSWNEMPAELPTPEPTAAAPTLADYEWCGYLLLDGVIVDADALALLGTLFPNEPDTPTQARLQWRANLAGTAGILEGCHLLPVERWRVVSLLQQATGMEYAQMDAALQFTQFPNADAVRAFLEQHAAEWEPADAPIPEATNEPS